ncbi:MULTISPECIES: metallophosphoesterase [unclassified Acidisoma]|jgi:3',5'-cyclic AMP phosphodiesterase CpdA|uniref:metallophosphoesterase family protein n=1 Tax=unclassified Acidisoma TaxID=2634065 RepID=UPI00131D3D43|nr:MULTISPECIES: metallophosphoesterase [unclassified Acidisoma]
MSFSLAHLSDLHLPPTQTDVSWRRLNGKQFLAFLSWRRKRHRVHTFQPMAALLADLASYAPDHIALTGDLVNFALPAEFRAVRQWLDQRGAPTDISVIPGNHDLTAQVSWQDGLGQWDAWMRGDAGGARGGAECFPFLRRRGPLALIGLSTAVTTRVFSAAGQLGRPQLDRLGKLLAETSREGLFRVVLIHHPPVMSRGGERKALRDRAAFCAVLKRQGAELVLHGHHHVTSVVGLSGPNGTIPSMGVPAALATTEKPEIAGWHLHRISRTNACWQLTTLVRRYDSASDSFRQAAEWTIDLPLAQ